MLPHRRHVSDTDACRGMKGVRKLGMSTVPCAQQEDSDLENEDETNNDSMATGNRWESTPALTNHNGEAERKIHLKTVFMLTSWGKTSPQTPGEKEEALLEACEGSEVAKVKEILNSEGSLNVNCVDILGRTPLLIAMEKENLQLLEMLLKKSNNRNVDTVLLHAINQCKETIAAAMLRHPQYIKRRANALKRLGTTTCNLDGDYPMTSNFYLDTTPIILASQKNLYAVVKLLHLRGERINRPHPGCCSCISCERRMRRDRLRYAHRRLNTYRGLASESYITLSSEDPFAEAFQLRQEVIKLSHYEKFFKKEYTSLARQLGQYVVRLLNEVRGSNELDLLLDKVDGDEGKQFEPLARIRRAIRIGEKKFVTHPSCQMKLTDIWYNDARFLQRANWFKRFLIFIGFVFIYPFVAILYLFIPNAQFLRLMRTPSVKFTAQASSFLIFLIAIAGWTLNYDPGGRFLIAVDGVNRTRIRRCGDNGADICLDIQDSSVTLFRCDKEDGCLVREMEIDWFEKMIFIWIMGLVWAKSKDIYKRGLVEHVCSIYNAVDIPIIILYSVAHSLGYVVVIKSREAGKFFQSDFQAFEKLADGNQEAWEHYYWITPDRFVWDMYDPEHLSEAAFAIANVFTFARMSYLLAANEIFGPLQISLGRMAYDILRFTVLFFIMMIAFIVGLDNLMWHYETDIHNQVDTQAIPAADVGDHFGTVEKTFRSVFWATFGLVEYDILKMDPYEQTLTQHVAYILLGAYMVAVSLVMLNMLIAMMNRSYDQIAQDADIEFKFARSKLYLEYIDSGSPLPVPFNLLPTANTFRMLLQYIPIVSRLVAVKDPVQDYESARTGGTKEKPLRKLTSKALFAELQMITYQDVIKKIVDRFISEVARKDDDDAEKQNIAEVVRQEIQSLRRGVQPIVTNSAVPDREDAENVKTCMSHLTQAVDKFIELQKETSKLVELMSTLNTKDGL